jgi:hypothetical protein
MTVPYDHPMTQPDPIGELALQEGRAAIAEQREALEKLRTRAVAYVAAVIAVAGFVGADAPGGWPSNVVRVLALVATLGVAWLSTQVLKPRKWKFILNANELAADPAWDDEARPELTLATFLAGHADHNDEQLDAMHNLFAWELKLGSAAVALWLVQAML